MEREDKFLKRAKRVLDGAERDLDAGTVARLRASRRLALESGRPRSRPGWLWPVGGFAAASIVLAVAGLLWMTSPVGRHAPSPFGDLDLLTALEQPEFYAELEFYEWLERHEQSG